MPRNAKPEGFWDDIVYPITSRVLKKAVKKGVVKNTTRVKANRAVLDKAFIAREAKGRARRDAVPRSFARDTERTMVKAGRRNTKQAALYESAERRYVDRTMRSASRSGLDTTPGKTASVIASGRRRSNYPTAGKNARSSFQADIAARQSPAMTAAKKARKKARRPVIAGGAAGAGAAVLTSYPRGKKKSTAKKGGARRSAK